MSNSIEDNQLQKLFGWWNVEVSSPSQGTFPALVTFTSDGSVIASESPLPFEGSGHGNWLSRGDGEVGYTFVALFGSQEGNNTGKLKVVGTLRLDAEEEGWHGPWKIDANDESGQERFADRGRLTLRRIRVEELD
jgi:hypothetical protein